MLNKILLALLFAYVFLAPFEDLLSYLYGVDTIFKPYRLAGLGMLLLGFFKNWKDKPFFVFPPDKVLALFLGYGILYTLFLYGLGCQVNLGQFANAMIQTTFLFLIHLTVKRMDISYSLLPKLLAVMSVGIALNAAIIALNFYVFQLSSREKGLSDNSNYAAFGMVVASLFFLWKIIQNKYRIGSLRTWLYSALVAFLFVSILATGSRTGFLLFVICSFVFLFVLSASGKRFQLLPYLIVVSGILMSSSSFREMLRRTIIFNRLEHATEDVRVPLAKAGMEAIWYSKFMGIGVAQMMDQKNFKKFMAPVNMRLVRAIEKRNKGLGLHNMYLELTVETGLLGISLFLFYLYRVLAYQWRMLRTSAYREIHELLFVLFLAALLMALTGKGILGALFWLMYTLASVYFKKDEETEQA